MENLFHIHKGDDFPRAVTAVIEVTYGSRAKYEYDIETGIMRLDRVLRTSARYPGNYGFIPQTLGNFRNPVDVYVILNEPLFPGCVLEVKPLGLLEMADEMGTDSKGMALRLTTQAMAPWEVRVWRIACTELAMPRIWNNR